MLEQAARERIVTAWVMRGRARVLWLRALGRLPDRPVFCREVYRDWMVRDS
jgi:hypothetical protein